MKSEDREKMRQNMRRWQNFPPSAHRLSRYKLSNQAFQSMLDRQDRRCLICETQIARLVIDHDHKTKRVRGLLCTTCNSGLGFFRDDLARVRRAAEYLDCAAKEDVLVLIPTTDDERSEIERQASELGMDTNGYVHLRLFGPEENRQTVPCTIYSIYPYYVGANATPAECARYETLIADEMRLHHLEHKYQVVVTKDADQYTLLGSDVEQLDDRLAVVMKSAWYRFCRGEIVDAPNHEVD